jgi:hypothetical protein
MDVVLLSLGIAALAAAAAMAPFVVHVLRTVNDPRLDNMDDDEMTAYLEERRASFLARFPRWLR